MAGAQAQAGSRLVTRKEAVAKTSFLTVEQNSKLDISPDPSLSSTCRWPVPHTSPPSRSLHPTGPGIPLLLTCPSSPKGPPSARCNRNHLICRCLFEGSADFEAVAPAFKAARPAHSSEAPHEAALSNLRVHLHQSTIVQGRLGRLSAQPAYPTRPATLRPATSIHAPC